MYIDWFGYCKSLYFLGFHLYLLTEFIYASKRIRKTNLNELNDSFFVHETLPIYFQFTLMARSDWSISFNYSFAY